jgi:hypothetical protein
VVADLFDDAVEFAKIWLFVNKNVNLDNEIYSVNGDHIGTVTDQEEGKVLYIE